MWYKVSENYIDRKTGIIFKVTYYVRPWENNSINFSEAKCERYFYNDYML